MKDFIKSENESERERAIIIIEFERFVVFELRLKTIPQFNVKHALNV